MKNSDVSSAFDSMLRTDYVPLSDTEKLNLLADYYVDYFGYLDGLLGSTGQLIVGRRGTGKTTLLYRALVECMRSWAPDYAGPAKPRTLGVYLDLDKCHSLAGSGDDYARFERAFVSELCDAIIEEFHRSWPELDNEPAILRKLFKPSESKQESDVRRELNKLVEVLTTGLPRFVDRSGPVTVSDSTRSTRASGGKTELGSEAALSVGANANNRLEQYTQRTAVEATKYELSISDLMRVISDLRNAASVPNFIIYIDEFSALPIDHQLRFTTLLKRLLGNQAGVVVKMCAITDNYELGTALILQRDLFELSLDLNSFVEKHGSVSGAMTQLELLTERIITERLSAFSASAPENVFDSPAAAYTELTRASMGVPRTIGIILQQAWSRAKQGSRSHMLRSDIDFGIRYASRAYLNQMMGASKNGIAIPEHVHDIWGALIERAITERSKSDSSASHFMTIPSHAEKLRFLNMFFLVHLIEEGRTTKKESRSRHLYSFDYGSTLDNYLGWGDDKNVIRQQRFVYDDVLADFDHYYKSTSEAKFECAECSTHYTESDLVVAGSILTFCPRDKSDLIQIVGSGHGANYTEEEVKIIGAIRSAARGDGLIARRIADDVGCYVQKVAKFGEKLNNQGIIGRERLQGGRPHIYYDESDAFD